MARSGISREKIFEAASAVETRGESVTIANVRRELGDTGSFTTIHAALKDWREEHRPAAPPAISEALEAMGGALPAIVTDGVTRWNGGADQPARMIGQGRGQILGRRQVGTVVVVQQKHPAGFEIEQPCHRNQGRVQRPCQIDLVIQRLGNGVENRKLAVAPP